MATPIVAVDIGGTHARFALAEVADGRVCSLASAVTLRTADHDSLPQAWAAFACRIGHALPRAAAIAIAGPTGGDLLALTNCAWTIRPALIGQALPVDQFTLINDFEAVGHAVAQAAPEHLIHLSGPDLPLPAAGTISIVGPGTGLGVAQVWRSGTGAYRVQPTEGGHIDFAPLDSVEDALLQALRARYHRVSAERVLSGPGLAAIYQTLARIEGRTVEDGDDETLWARGLAGEDRLASAAIDRFCLSLGSVAGDVALAHGAVGVVIAGGLGLRLKDRLARSGFANRFRAKGRFETLMARLPVKLITHPQPGLFGAAAAFAMEFDT